ncbi:MAG: hypothetical protein GXP23_04560 [Gammaproteobacteria bacterium]|nr:hypothetical protein [Gammaproteobacteria bacterium]
MSENERYIFPGTKINVEWDGRLCIHIAECGHAKGDLFIAGRQPWCQPDLVTLEDVIDVVERCPSGALTYETSVKTVKESPDQENSVSVSYNGPYFVRGELDIEGSADDMEGVAFRVALCRCGHSKNKPFCDNSHEAIGFRDYGAVGEKGEGLTKKGGKLKITPLEDGPLLLSGNLTIKNSSGRVAWQGTEVALCRCGASENKPFCDGSHVAAGFKSK